MRGCRIYSVLLYARLHNYTQGTQGSVYHQKAEIDRDWDWDCDYFLQAYEELLFLLRAFYQLRFPARIKCSIHVMSAYAGSALRHCGEGDSESEV